MDDVDLYRQQLSPPFGSRIEEEDNAQIYSKSSVDSAMAFEAKAKDEEDLQLYDGSGGPGKIIPEFVENDEDRLDLYRNLKSSPARNPEPSLHRTILNQRPLDHPKGCNASLCCRGGVLNIFRLLARLQHSTDGSTPGTRLRRSPNLQGVLFECVFARLPIVHFDCADIVQTLTISPLAMECMSRSIRLRKKTGHLWTRKRRNSTSRMERTAAIRNTNRTSILTPTT